MSKQIDFIIDAELEITCSISEYVPAKGPTYSHGGLPEEPSEVEDLAVGITINKHYIDLNGLLTGAQIEHIKALCFEELENRL